MGPQKPIDAKSEITILASRRFFCHTIYVSFEHCLAQAVPLSLHISQQRAQERLTLKTAYHPKPPDFGAWQYLPDHIDHRHLRRNGLCDSAIALYSYTLQYYATADQHADGIASPLGTAPYEAIVVKELVASRTMDHASLSACSYVGPID